MRSKVCVWKCISDRQIHWLSLLVNRTQRKETLSLQSKHALNFRECKCQSLARSFTPGIISSPLSLLITLKIVLMRVVMVVAVGEFNCGGEKGGTTKQLQKYSVWALSSQSPPQKWSGEVFSGRAGIGSCLNPLYKQVFWCHNLDSGALVGRKLPQLVPSGGGFLSRQVV